MEKKDEIAKNIKELVKASGKRMNQIAYEMDVNEGQLYSYTSGRYLPSALAIIKLCEVLDCTYEDILGKIK